VERARHRSSSGEHSYAKELQERKEAYLQQAEEIKTRAELQKQTVQELIAKKENRRRVFLAAAQERKAKEVALEREMTVEVPSEPSIFNLQMGPGSPVGTGLIKKMISITPVPGFVMKVKRNNGEKVFVNVCSHTSVKSGTEIRLSQLKHDKDKSGKLTAVYDAVVSDEMMQSVAADPGLHVKQDLGLDIMAKLEKDMQEEFDVHIFTTPLIKNDYKGDKVRCMQIEVFEERPAVVAANAPVSRRGFMKRDAPSENVMRPKPFRRNEQESSDSFFD